MSLHDVAVGGAATLIIFFATVVFIFVGAQLFLRSTTFIQKTNPALTTGFGFFIGSSLFLSVWRMAALVVQSACIVLILDLVFCISIFWFVGNFRSAWRGVGKPMWKWSGCFFVFVIFLCLFTIDGNVRPFSTDPSAGLGSMSSYRPVKSAICFADHEFSTKRAFSKALFLTGGVRKWLMKTDRCRGATLCSHVVQAPRFRFTVRGQEGEIPPGLLGL